MTRVRNQQVCLDATPYYHCVSRCVRRTFLCGYDDYSKRDFEHRRGWIESRIKMLSQIYCIDICAYAVMSNHYHLVVHINKSQALKLNELEVVELWSKMHSLPVLIQRWLKQELKGEAEHTVVQEIIQTWRERLYSLSWFMRELNFDIALKANQEENCKGHFWESRYKSQALLDEKALLAAMAYTDLNPIRAGMADTPEHSDYTSVKERLSALAHQQTTAPCLHPFIGNASNEMLSGIPFRLVDYIELVDWTGREFREGKASISSHQPPLLKRLNINQKAWLKACTQLEKQRALCIGMKESIQCNLSRLHRRRMCGYQLN
ncbi:transposase [Vibrio sp. MACH09]|uniref:transposase n=1 Tax=Vibrio sp. MACH09 TaxID=3025122 RepID=UPI00278CF7D3|nr:transposase [Vibrio sp. MACH09]GLO63234.1 transposase [Vibrio sp. MACH09]